MESIPPFSWYEVATKADLEALRVATIAGERVARLADLVFDTRNTFPAGGAHVYKL